MKRGVFGAPGAVRATVYRLLEQVLRTGQPREIERGGRTLRIFAVEPPSRVDALPTRPEFPVGNPEDLVHRVD